MLARPSGRIACVSLLGADGMTMTAAVRADRDPTPTVLALDAEREDGDARIRRRVAQGLAALARSHRLPRRASARWQPGPHLLSVSVNGRRDAAARFVITE